MIGVTVNEVNNRLGASYTLDDVDKVCEELQAYTLNMGKLPFSLGRTAKVTVTESKK